MSMGAIVPTSTRLRLSASVCRDSSSVCRCTARFDSATTRSQYAFLTSRIVVTTVLRRSNSLMARLVRLTRICWRVLSIERLRSSGCVNENVRLPCVEGLRAANSLFVSLRWPWKPKLYEPPVGRNCSMPTVALTPLLVSASSVVSRNDEGGRFELLYRKLLVSDGSQLP